MPTAVIRVVVDPTGALTGAQYEAALGDLRNSGVELIAPSVEHLPESAREIEVIADLDGADPDSILRACANAFPSPVSLGVITYISRGTDDDAQGVLQRFGIAGEVRRETDGEDEVVHVTLERSESRRVPESRVHTALEAALNCEVRIHYR